MTEEELNQQAAEDLVEKGILWRVMNSEGEHVNYSLTEYGLKLTEEMFPDIAVHESYYKWKLA